MQLPSTRALYLPIVSLTLLLSGIAAHGASFVTSTAACSTPLGANDQQSSTTPGGTSSATLAGCVATAQADFGTLRGTATTGGGNTFGSYNSQFYIEYFLTNASLDPNTPTTLTIPLDYHVNIDVGSGAAGFTMFHDSNVSPFWLINIQSTSDPFLPNICPTPEETLPRCNGSYTGTVAVTTSALINSATPNRFWITLNGTAFNSASSDAWNTVTIGESTLPAGLTVSYADLSGNPLNLQNATSGVPEPGALGLVAAALCAIVVKRRLV